MATYPKPFTALSWTVRTPRAFAGNRFLPVEVTFANDDTFAIEEAEKRGARVCPLTCGLQNVHGYRALFGSPVEARDFLQFIQ